MPSLLEYFQHLTNAERHILFLFSTVRKLHMFLLFLKCHPFCHDNLPLEGNLKVVLTPEHRVTATLFFVQGTIAFSGFVA